MPKKSGDSPGFNLIDAICKTTCRSQWSEPQGLPIVNSSASLVIQAPKSPRSCRETHRLGPSRGALALVPTSLVAQVGRVGGQGHPNKSAQVHQPNIPSAIEKMTQKCQSNDQPTTIVGHPPQLATCFTIVAHRKSIGLPLVKPLMSCESPCDQLLRCSFRRRLQGFSAVMLAAMCFAMAQQDPAI